MKLFVPRKEVYLQKVEGKVDVTTDDFPHPLAMIPSKEPEEGDIQGYNSGVRSAVVEMNGTGYRLKGCLFAEDPGRGGSEPYGVRSVGRSEKEVEAAKLLQEVFADVGRRYVMNPVGTITYDPNEFRDEVTEATVFNVLGDTRLDEFLRFLDENERFVRTLGFGKGWVLDWGYNKLLEQIGKDAGYAMRVMHDAGVTWDYSGGDHPGNLTLYQDGNNVWVAPVDLNVFIRNPQSEDHIQDTNRNVTRMEKLIRRKINGSEPGAVEYFTAHSFYEGTFHIGDGNDYTRVPLLFGFTVGYEQREPGNINLEQLVQLPQRIPTLNRAAEILMNRMLDHGVGPLGEGGNLVITYVKTLLDQGASVSHATVKGTEFSQQLGPLSEKIRTMSGINGNLHNHLMWFIQSAAIKGVPLGKDLVNYITEEGKKFSEGGWLII